MVQDARVRVAALYDIHGNVPALEAVLAEVDRVGVDTILIGGDVASGPMPAETMDLLEGRSEEVRFVRGNADRVLDFSGNPGGDLELWRRTRLWVAQRLGQERLEFLAGLPVDETLEVDELGPVRFCHGAPGSDEEVITRVTPEERLLGLLEGVEESVVVCGHTHVQFDRRVGDRRVANAGSVGFPYEGALGAYWLVLGPELSFRRTDYDVTTAVERIRATGYPNVEMYVAYLADEDPERPERMSRLIEFGPD